MLSEPVARRGTGRCSSAQASAGGLGFSEEYGVIHYHTAARLVRTAPITAEMILNFVAEHRLGLPNGD